MLPPLSSASPILYTQYSILSSPSLPDIVEDEHFFEYVGQEGDKLLMRRLVKILLLQRLLRSEGQREDVGEALVEAFRAYGATVIADVKASGALFDRIADLGGQPVMWKTGHSLIKKKMKQTGSLLAGEMSGHIFIKERWYGFDDGIYSAARLLEILSKTQQSAEDLFAAFPNDISTPEINIDVTDEGKFSIIDALQRDADWGEAHLTTIDGVRVDYPHGWGLVRASNTTPVLVLRFEAETEEELERIKEVFRAQLYSTVPDLDLPF